MRRRLVAALDYGTSNSGAAYAIVHEGDKQDDANDDIEVVKNWPRAGASRDGAEKVPSDIVYNSDGQPIGYGHGASQHDAAPLQWVKLLLEPDSLRENSSRTSRVWDAYYALDSEALRKRPVDAVGDYLRWLWQRVKAAIIEREGEDQDTELFAPDHLTVVLTVPASWSAPAKQRMATAAYIAGIPEQCIKTLSEPEAAAIYGLKKKARQRHVHDGDCVIVIDAGGGTVDAVAYQIRKREPLSVAQITLCKGDFCGSSFVNREFKNQLRSMLGDKFETLSKHAKDRINEEIEYSIKRSYDPFGDPSTYYLPVAELADDDELGIQNGRMRVDEAAISTSFESVMTQIMTLIDAQISEVRRLDLHENLKGLLIVGGFGKSEFLRARIRQEFHGKNDPKVWAADDSWTAVVRGAVACETSSLGQLALIHSRLSSYNYGIRYTHGGRRRVQWLVHKGQSIRSDMCTEPYGLRIDDRPWLDQDENCIIIVPIVASNADNPSDEDRDDVAPHAEIKCRVPTRLRFAPESQEIRGLSTRAWHIPANLVLYFDGALISFRCKIGDREVGVAEVKYFEVGTDCLTEEDDGSEPPTPLLEKTEKHIRVDSIHSISKSSLPQMPPGSGHSSAPAELDLNKETAPSLSPSASSSNKEEKKDKKDKRRASKHYLSVLTTTRDTPRQRHKFLGPSVVSDESPEKHPLDKVWRKGWEPRKD